MRSRTYSLTLEYPRRSTWCWTKDLSCFGMAIFIVFIGKFLISFFHSIMDWQKLSISTDTTCRGLPDRVLDVRCVIGRSIPCSLVERRRIDPPHFEPECASFSALLTRKKAGEWGTPSGFASYNNPCCRNEKYPT